MHFLTQVRELVENNSQGLTRQQIYEKVIDAENDVDISRAIYQLKQAGQIIEVDGKFHRAGLSCVKTIEVPVIPKEFDYPLPILPVKTEQKEDNSFALTPPVIEKSLPKRIVEYLSEKTDWVHLSEIRKVFSDNSKESNNRIAVALSNLNSSGKIKKGERGMYRHPNSVITKSQNLGFAQPVPNLVTTQPLKTGDFMSYLTDMEAKAVKDRQTAMNDAIDTWKDADRIEYQRMDSRLNTIREIINKFDKGFN